MKTVLPYKKIIGLFMLVAVFGLVVPARATVLLDQTAWTSTTQRRTQNLPTNSAWFSSSTGSLSTSGGAMRMIVGTGSGMAMTYFTPLSNSPPVQLNVGDTLTATFKFTFNFIPTPGSTSQGFKFGLFDFADGSNVPLRVSADGSFSSSSQGINVSGYSLFGKMYQTFADTSPIDIRKRTTISDGSLMGTSGDWTSLAKGGTNILFPGFSNSTPYSLQFVLQRISLTAMAITETWSNFANGATISVSTVDSSATSFSFDGIAYRPQNNTEAPVTNLFQEVKVEVTSVPVTPSITTQPMDQTVSSGQTVTFSPVYNGTLPLFYQWYYDTNTVLGSATNSTLTLTNVQVTDSGGYSVIVSNTSGSVTSTVAMLTVNLAAPLITSQPQDLTAIPGENPTFSVSVVGSEPFTYQWYYNTTTLLTNATDSTLTLSNVQASDAGTYSVVISNPVDFVTSSNAVLTVDTNPAAPVFITQPVSVSVLIGSNPSFTAQAVGTLPISYQWSTNGFPISGATSSTLNLVNVQLADAGNYSVTASNSVGTTNSDVAVLTVTPKMPPPLPMIPTNQFIITDFGAVGDGVTNNAVAIQNTINAAATAGGGIVVVPVSGTLSNYLSGPIVLSNSVNLQVNAGATLKMLPRALWPSLLPPFISGSGLHDIEISGSGTIDGNAGFGSANWWPNLDTAHRPDFIHFDTSCTRILIQGVTLQNPPAFHLMLKGNNVSVTIQNITINTPGTSPNTDGMDLASTNVLVQNCSISDGDDNIEIGGSGGPAADITVSNCTFGVGHGVSVGSITQGGVHDLLVSNCTFVGTDYGIRMKSDRDIGGLVQNLVYRDITMTNVGYPIAIYSYYDTIGTPNVITPNTAAANAAQSVVTLTPIWQNILISNVTATTSTGGGSSGIIWGRQEMLVSNVTLIDVNISNPTNTFSIYNAQAIQIIDSQLTAPTSTNTLTLYNAQVTVTNSVANTNLVTLGGLAIPPTNNVLIFFNTLAAVTDTKLLGTGSITLNGSTLTFTQAAATFSNGFSVTSTSTLSMTSGSNTFNGSLSGSGALTLNLPANSRLILRTDSSGFNGPLVVSNSGTLLVNNTTGSGTGVGAVTIVSGAILGGGGIIGGPVTVNGILAPGNSPGTLTISNNTVINGSAVLQYELGTNSDQTVVSGNLTLGGTLNITDSGGFTNNTYTLFTYGGTLTYNGVSIGTTPAGHNYAIDTSTPGQVNLNVTSPLTAFQQWQILYFGSTTNANADPNADPDGDGQNNLAEFLSGTNPTNSASGLRIVSALRQGSDVVITWTTSGGFTNAVQATAGNGSGGYATNFTDISSPIIISGSGDVTTNYVDGGAATNVPSRFYRIRLMP